MQLLMLKRLASSTVMTDKEFAEFVSHIDFDILPTRKQPTKEEEERA